ncbi:cytochrome P450 [Streptomyces sp. NPDC056296]|uniref:cytochrome P450 n=1 Tax=Streptomyces sp. NPDC056296 TaxID=3345775 RepID=UPI0035DF1037
MSRLALPDGDEGWLVSRYDDVAAVLTNPAFTVERRGFNNAVSTERITDEELWDAGIAPTSMAMDPPDHTRYRGMLQGQFTVRRMRSLLPQIEALVEECLDAMESQGPPVDLMEEFAFAIPAIVICDLLGIPPADRAEFKSRIETLNLDIPKSEKLGAIRFLGMYMRGLVEEKRRNPDDALISGLIQAVPEDGVPLKVEEILGLGNLLLIAGHETTANMIGLGTLALLTHPDQWASVRDHPESIDRTVEELLRYVSIVEFGLLRVAAEDTKVGGQPVAAGEKIIVSLASADRDPAHFESPDTLDLNRGSVRHLGFGYGAFQCLGQQLARLELRVALSRLAQRFPNLTLATDVDELRARPDSTIYGVDKLLVSW